MHEKQGISIVIPTYNEASTIKVLLEHLFSLKLDNLIDVIIVDACNSDDKLESQISNYPIQFICSSKTSRAAQMNLGASKAKFETLYFVHADAIPPKNFYPKIIQSLENGFDFGYFRYEFNSKHPLLKINSYFSQFKGFYTGGGDQSFYINKSTFTELGGFNEDLHLCEDFDLFDRLKSKNFRYEIINAKVKISPRKYENNNYIKVNLANFYVLRNFRKGVSTEVLKNKYQKMLRKN